MFSTLKWYLPSALTSMFVVFTMVGRYEPFSIRKVLFYILINNRTIVIGKMGNSWSKVDGQGK